MQGSFTELRVVQTRDIVHRLKKSAREFQLPVSQKILRKIMTALHHKAILRIRQNAGANLLDLRANLVSDSYLALFEFAQR